MNRSLLLLALAFATLTANADTVTPGQAQAIASAFMQSHGLHEADTPKKISGKAGKAQPYYIINATDGYVVVAGDDAATPILAYGTGSPLNTDALPPAMAEMLRGYERQITWLSQNPDKIRPAKEHIYKADLSQSVRPLVTAQWGQGAPYNNQTPAVNGTHTITGCVATALAQIMYTHKWPQAACKEIPAYNHEDDSDADEYAVVKADAPLPPTVFNWQAMSDTPSRSGDPEGAMAELNHYCGQAVEMKYGLKDSGAYTKDCASVLVNYFDYDPGITRQVAWAYTTADWTDLILTELQAGRPVLYTAANETSGGHAFIVDGYDAATGKFHVNWGWDGFCNGYFVLDVLSASYTVRGVSRIVHTYSNNQTAFIGIQPNVQTPLPAPALIFWAYYKSDTPEELWPAIYNTSISDFNGQLRLVLNPTNVDPANEEQATGYYIVNLKIGGVTNGIIGLNLAKTVTTLPDGTYTTDLSYREGTEGEWKPMNGQIRVYALVTVKDGSVTSVTLHPDDFESAGYLSAKLSLTDGDVVAPGSSLKFNCTISNSNATDTWLNAMTLCIVKISDDHIDPATAVASFLSKDESTRIQMLSDAVKSLAYSAQVAPASQRTFTWGADPVSGGSKSCGTYMAYFYGDDNLTPLATTVFYIENGTGIGSIDSIDNHIHRGVLREVYDALGRRIDTRRAPQQGIYKIKTR